ncbi:MAG: glycosyltransferase [Gammaproteobacteria bacterium]|jgi:glycosyltransferase involved in cell wall biosynthesis|nr:glycosyltransferase [Gammaproteobacteria bacterium]
MSTRKVMLFMDSLESGGAQRQMVTLANVLHQRGYAVSITTYYPGDQLSGFLCSPAIGLHYVPRTHKYDVSFLGRLTRFFRSEAPDCIISYLTTANFWARIAGSLAGVTAIITSERSLNLRAGLLPRLVENTLWRLSSTIVVNSAQGGRNLAAIGIPKDRIQVIYNGLDHDQFARQPAAAALDFRRAHGIGAADFLVLLPGRMSAEKNHRLLVECVARLDPAWKVRVAFAGNEFYPEVKREVQARIAAHGIGDQFIFLGPRGDMPVLYSAADVVVLPSLWEGFPNVLVEAMACGAPVIASDVSDNSTIVEDGTSGFIFPSDDADALAGCLQKILAMTAGERAAMGQAGAVRAGRLCSLESFGDQYAAIIEKACAGTRQRR